MSKVENILRSMPLFADLDAVKFRELQDLLTPRTVAKGEQLLREGEEGDSLFIVVSGSFQVTRTTEGKQEQIAEVGAGQLLGEAQIMTGGRRTASATACVTSEVSVIERQDWYSFSLDTDIPDALFRLTRRRLGANLLRDLLRRRFEDTTGEVLETLVQSAVIRYVDDRTVLVEQGDPSRSIYYLLQGEMEVLVDGQRVAALTAGQTAGETAVTTGGPRSATLMTRRPCLLAQIASDVFMDAARREPSLLVTIMRSLQQRLQGTSKVARHVCNFIALVPGSSSITAHMMDDIVRHGFMDIPQSTVITQADLQRRFRDPDIANAVRTSIQGLGIDAYFSELERKFEHVVLVADGSCKAWMSRIGAIASELVVVVHQDDPGDLGPAELSLRARFRGRAPNELLVVLREPAIRPTKTARFLQARDATHVVHAVLGMAGDYARVGRLVTGRAVGLCISGGGAFGFAGFGLITAMKELGIPIDGVGGASAGGMVASLYSASNGDYLKTQELMGRMMRAQQLYGLFDGEQIPIVALTKGKYFRRAIRDVFGNHQIEDFPIPLLLTSANVTTAQECHAVRGPFVEHYYATNAYPPFLPPAVIDGSLHVDGGLMNNVPVEAVKALVKGGPVVALDVTPSKGFDNLDPTPDGITGLQVLYSRLMPGVEQSKRWPIDREITSRLKMVNHIRNTPARRAAAAFYFQPDQSDFRIWHHRKWKKIAHACHNEVLEPLSAWWEAEKQ